MAGRLRDLPLWALLLTGAVCGLLLAAGFEPFRWWLLALAGIAGLSLTTWSTRAWWQAALAGLAFGASFLVASVNWMTVIAAEAFAGLVLAEAVYYAVLGVLLRFTSGVRFWPLLAAACWSLVDFVFSRFPFGGFPWLRLGYVALDTPLAGFLPLIGLSGVSFLVAAFGTGAAWLVRATTPVRNRLAAVGAASLLATGGAAVPAMARGDTGTEGEVSVGYVQGGAPGGGVYGIGEARRTTFSHLAETQNLMAKVDAGQAARPDFVVWPENGTDLDADTDPLTRQAVLEALSTVEAPMLIGTITDGPGVDERQTASQWWTSDGRLGPSYYKRNIVPFGEWIPFRSVLLPVFPMLRYVGAQSVPGTGPGVLQVRLDDGRELGIGLVVCYEVAYDSTVYESIAAGAQVIVVQSSNAMYLDTSQMAQQYAITRARALETQREILVVTTSGISGLIRPDGTEVFRLPERSAASGVVTLPLRSNLTPANWLGPLLDAGIAGAALLAVVLVAVRKRGSEVPESGGGLHGSSG